MPRTSQAPQAANNQAYGLRGDQIQAQQAMPIPQSDPVPQAPTPSPGDPDLMAMAQQFDPGITPLSAPTQRPGEPVTTGLSMGAGAGPEIFSSPARAQRSADMLDMLAQFSGDDRTRQMAARIRATGGLR